MYSSDNLLKKYNFNTLYLGGGTPSIATPKDLSQFFKFLDEQKMLSSLKEITIEMNPESVSEELLLFYKSIGINRVSLGIQSLDQKILEKLGRLSSLKENIEAIKLVKKHFDNYSLDLMYGIPDQNLCEELFSYATFDPPHISTYCLTLYEGTDFYLEKEKWEQGQEEFLEQTNEIEAFLSLSGYHHYEVSNFSKKGLESLHNLHYWKKHHYLGLGAGASGYLDNLRYTNHYLGFYENGLSKKEKPLQEKDFLTLKDDFFEIFLLKIRLKESFYIDDLLKSLEKSLREQIEDFLNFLDKESYMTYGEKDKKVTPNQKTWLFSDYISKQIASLLNIKSH